MGNIIEEGLSNPEVLIQPSSRGGVIKPRSYGTALILKFRSSSSVKK
jgi:hypothetical protein